MTKPQALILLIVFFVGAVSFVLALNGIRVDTAGFDDLNLLAHNVAGVLR